MNENTREIILSAEDLTVAFRMYDKGFRKKNLEVIHSLSLSVAKGEILAVVGSSGSGKSVLAHAALGLLPGNAVTGGEIRYRGEILTDAMRKKLLGRKIAYIPQSVDYLDPLMKVGRQVQGVYGTRQRQKELFRQFQLSEKTETMYPFQLSGGMARRVLISSALLEQPDLIIADEPTPGLDLGMAMETLIHFRNLADQGTGVLLITHDIDLALHVADRIAVFYAGTIVEVAPKEDFLAGRDALRHPYSRAFLDALPQNAFKAIPGTQPYAGNLPSGCLFAERCPYRDEKCAGEIPLRKVRDGEVRCVHAAESGTY